MYALWRAANFSFWPLENYLVFVQELFVALPCFTSNQLSLRVFRLSLFALLTYNTIAKLAIGTVVVVAGTTIFCLNNCLLVRKNWCVRSLETLNEFCAIATIFWFEYASASVSLICLCPFFLSRSLWLPLSPSTFRCPRVGYVSKNDEDDGTTTKAEARA